MKKYFFSIIFSCLFITIFLHADNIRKNQPGKNLKDQKISLEIDRKTKNVLVEIIKKTKDSKELENILITSEKVSSKILREISEQKLRQQENEKEIIKLKTKLHKEKNKKNPPWLSITKHSIISATTIISVFIVSLSFYLAVTNTETQSTDVEKQKLAK